MKHLHGQAAGAKPDELTHACTHACTDDDHPKEECGVFGIFYPGEDVARLSFFALYALQHRGQESAGIAVSDGHMAYIHKGMGLVSHVFTEETLQPLEGKLAIAHTRYSTTGILKAAQCPAFPDRDGVGAARRIPQRQLGQCPHATTRPASARRWSHVIIR